MAIFTNQATLSYRNGTVSSNTVTGEILEALSVTKTALPDTYSRDDVITYVVSIINSGAAAVSGVTVTDDLGAYPFNLSTLVPLTYVPDSAAYYLDGVLQPTPTVSAGTNLVFENITVPANGNAILIYQARINQYAPLSGGSEIVNNVSVTGAGICNDVAATETITASSEPSLGITKEIFPSTVTENGQLTYTFTVQNFGNVEASAADDLAIIDTFEPALGAVTVTYNGVAWTQGVQYNYDPATGVFSTVAGNITVPAATYMQDPVSGEWSIRPGESVIVVTGRVYCNA